MCGAVMLYTYQGAKKLVSVSPGLVDFPARLIEFLSEVLYKENFSFNGQTSQTKSYSWLVNLPSSHLLMEPLVMINGYNCSFVSFFCS